jgi:hypothetical protein
MAIGRGLLDVPQHSLTFISKDLLYSYLAKLHDYIQSSEKRCTDFGRKWPGLFKGINMAVPGWQDEQHHDKNNPLEITITAF